VTERVELMLPASDNYRLRATIWEGADSDPTVIIAPATGVLRSYYRPFAEYLVERGFQVVTYDNRGIGESRPVSMKGFSALMQDWGEKDLEGIIRWLGSSKPDSKILLVGHSAGGQLVGFAPSREKFRGMVFVSVQSGYWGHWTGWRRPAIKLLWYVAIPALSNIFGYFPARRLGLGEDLPIYVAQQWAEWGRSPGYIFDHVLNAIQDAYKSLQVPLRAYSFTDDLMYAPKGAVEQLLGFYASAPTEHLHVAPGDRGLSKIGHWGFFRKSIGREAFWPETADWLWKTLESGAAVK
jgi:predicted alpha/beta hydrolase